MTNSKIMRVISGTALAFTVLAPTLVLAAATGIDAALNTGVNTQTQAQTGGGNTGASVNAGASVQLSAAVTKRAKEKATKEIDRRIAALTDLNTRVGQMTKVSAELKQNLVLNTQNQITTLNNLKTQITNETDGAALKTQVQSITTDYRVYALVLPQTRIAAAADREATLINMLAEIGSKLQARLTAAQQAGANVSAYAQPLSDMGTRLGSAQTHAQAALTGAAQLTPDGGDAAKIKANTDALKKANAEIKAAQQDLIAARKAADTIIKGLKTLQAGASATTSTQVR
ncbi:MAG TPA: hypothetical protein VD928_03175 [Candidatus Paceibacterota bacterium]|nr:hypothetical protein [Candidatus Paceibacterota bacterium]